MDKLEELGLTREGETNKTNGLIGRFLQELADKRKISLFSPEFNVKRIVGETSKTITTERIKGVVLRPIKEIGGLNTFEGFFVKSSGGVYVVKWNDAGGQNTEAGGNLPVSHYCSIDALAHGRFSYAEISGIQYGAPDEMCMGDLRVQTHFPCGVPDQATGKFELFGSERGDLFEKVLGYLPPNVGHYDFD